ncbi:MAG TPA: nucleotide kinase domain-containing protein [Mucilaginibacter sp.]|nr:nucleotide kinase domain-containing protein [Mucilaginibacter sp.]
MKIRDEAYHYYFYFIQERMNIFWKRYEGKKHSLTSDNILSKHKFTNVYRAQDRVSQYLIKNVIFNQSEKFSEIDVLLRILVFKIFNNIDTWEYLEKKNGVLKEANFNVGLLSNLLEKRITTRPIFSAAYMMTGTHRDYDAYRFKHEKWLRMVDHEMLKGKKFGKVLKARSLEEIYNILSSCAFIGPFLAYQYAIDFNYSDVIDFDENSFVKAGIGSIRGIKKCFPERGKYSFEDCIRFTQDNFDFYQQKYGFTAFKNLFGREPKLIDLQNCFCETDKYLRVKMPEIMVGNVRIKQKFVKPKSTIEFYFPPKWGINKYIEKCNTGNSQELILF